MNQFFEERVSACKKEKAALLEEGREDEAILEQIRCNVYEIFQTVWNLNRGTEFFREKLTTIPMNWHAAAVKAKSHDDETAVMLEQIKLDTVQRIRDALEARV